MIRFRRQLQNVHDAMEAREQALGQHGFGQPALPTTAASMVHFFSGTISSQDKAVQQLALMLVFTAFKFFEGAKVSVWAIAKADIFEDWPETTTSFDPVSHRMVKRIDVRPLEIKILTFLDFEVGRTPAVVYFDEAMAVAHRQPSLWFDTDCNNLNHRIADVLHCCTAQNGLESFDDQVRSWLTICEVLVVSCLTAILLFFSLFVFDPGSISGDGGSSVRSVICFVRIEGTTHPPHRIVLSAARFALCRSRLPSEGDQHAAAYDRPW